ncbi:MAG: flavin reductase family protein [Lachnospiraceae bacterium]|jgi:flavin reductase (DIM6/NTAB) family NADH-FMN oxidoreductase RutF
MSKVEWRPGNMLYPLPAVLVTVADEKGNDNVLTVAWAGTVCSSPAMVSISVRPERYSYHMIKETKEFVINLTTEKLARATDFCGVRSGRDTDKFQEMKLTREAATYVGAPLIKESPVSIECRVVDEKEYGSHCVFTAEVLSVHVEADYLDEKGKFDLAAAHPIVYSHGEYYGLGKKLGKFGYSVQKKRPKKKNRG